MGAPPKLTAEQVADARRRFAAKTATLRQLADEYGMSDPAMRHALTGRTWAHLTDPPPIPVARHPGRPQALTADQVAHARRQVAQDPAALGDLAQVYGVGYSSLEHAVYGISWAHLTRPAPLPRPDPVQDANGTAKLTPQGVAQLRRDYLAGKSITTLAEAAGVAHSTARDAVHGVHWRSVTDPPPVPVADPGGAFVLGEDDGTEIVRLRDEEGLTWSTIGTRLGVTKSTALRAYRRAAGTGTVSNPRRRPRARSQWGQSGASRETEG